MRHLAILTTAVLSLTLLTRPVLAGELIPDDILAQMRDADVVILGEVHDNPLHHLVQTEAIADIDTNPHPKQRRDYHRRR